LSAAAWRTRIPQWLDRIQPSETTVLLVTAVGVGVATGLGAVLFIALIAEVGRVLFEGGEGLLGGIGRGLVLIVPAVGGLLAGPIIAFFAHEAKGHGVPEVIQAIAVRGGRMRPRLVVAKVLASALCIGSGGSAGREGPIVQVGAAVGSAIGQWLRLSEARIRNLVACGAAAGIAATFNAPIAGVIFAMEIILGELHLGELGNVVVSAVTAATVSRAFLGDQPAFAIPRYAMRTPWEVLLYSLLGILAAFVAVGFIRLLYAFEDRFDAWRFPEALKPAVGGLLLGLLGFAYPAALALWIPAEEAGLALPVSAHLPQVFGSGFGVIGQALLGRTSLVLLLALVLLKPLATSLTLGSGNSGGVFAPSLFTGVALGGAFGAVVERLFPGMTAGPGAFAAVGMAAVFAGAARAPITAVLIVFEMTNDYRLIVPLMAGVVFSLVVAERLHPESIYTLKLVRRGIRLHAGRDVDVMESVKVEEVMVRQPVVVREDLPVTRLAGEFIRTGRHGFPVVDEDGSLVGVVSLEDYRRASSEREGGADELRVGEIATRDMVIVHPDDTVGTALRRMSPRDLSRLPVVAHDDAHHLLGVVRRNDLVRAYEVGALRREQARQRGAVAAGLRPEQAEVVEVTLGTDSALEGRAVAESGLPRDAVLVSIRRSGELVIPHGDTVLAAGDLVTALCSGGKGSAVRRLLQRKKAEAATQGEG
jgi:CIC family chloride channel protein